MTEAFPLRDLLGGLALTVVVFGMVVAAVAFLIALLQGPRY